MLLLFSFWGHLDSFSLSKHFIMHSSIPGLQYASMIATDFQLSYPETKVELYSALRLAALSECMCPFI